MITCFVIEFECPHRRQAVEGEHSSALPKHLVARGRAPAAGYQTRDSRNNERVNPALTPSVPL
eukprot:3762277-Pleurochrysis_carterae.AAC.2